MNKNLARAQAQFPMVLMTLISIIQALALEILWSKIVDSPWLWEGDMQALIGWGMVVVGLMGILQIWVMYTTMVMGFVWQPFLRDSIVPFIIGIQEFMLITLIGEEFSGLWFYVLGSLFVSANWVSHNSLRRARQDPENSYFFDKMKPATLRDFIPAIGVVAILLLLGLITDVGGDRVIAPLVALVFANIVMLVQMFAARRLWRSLMGMENLS